MVRNLIEYRGISAAVGLLIVVMSLAGVVVAADGVFDVREYGALGDGKTDDTAAVNKAMEACCDGGGGQVRLGPGRYVCGTVRLKDNVILYLEAGARLVGSDKLELYESFSPPANTPEAGFGKTWHSALILGVSVKNAGIAGAGVIDGNKVFNPRGEEKMRGPHTIILGNSRDVSIRDVTIVDSANYAVMIEFSQGVEVRDVKVTGGWDGVHFRGWSDNPCRDISIIDCQFFTGDDAIAGRYVEGLLIRDCIVNSSCNGIRIIGPAKDMIVDDCLFYGPGLHPHRTSKRTNMLSAIILQPGGWDACPGALEDVVISNITAVNVASPVTVLMKRAGNTVDNITVTGLNATGVYRAGVSVESWTETACGRVTFRDASIEYVGGGTKKQADGPVERPGVDCRALPAWGFYARNAENVVLQDVRLCSVEDDLRPVIRCEDVNNLTLDEVHYPELEGADDAVILKDTKLVD